MKYPITISLFVCQVKLNDHLEKSLEAVGFICDNGVTKNYLIVNDIPSEPPPLKTAPNSQSLEALETDSTRLAICPSTPSNVCNEGNSLGRQGIGNLLVN